MKTYSDLEIAKQLEQLLHTIEKGITLANDTVDRGRKLEKQILENETKFEEIKSDIFQAADEVKDVAKNIQVAEQIFQDVKLAVNEVGGKQGLENLQHEYKTIRNTLNEAKLEIERLQIKLQTQVEQQQFLRIWLFGVSFGMVLALILVLTN
jgi:methyl-accepting chemotaxis protein